MRCHLCRPKTSEDHAVASCGWVDPWLQVGLCVVKVAVYTVRLPSRSIADIVRSRWCRGRGGSGFERLLAAYRLQLRLQLSLVVSSTRARHRLQRSALCVNCFVASWLNSATFRNTTVRFPSRSDKLCTPSPPWIPGRRPDRLRIVGVAFLYSVSKALPFPQGPTPREPRYFPDPAAVSIWSSLSYRPIFSLKPFILCLTVLHTMSASSD